MKVFADFAAAHVTTDREHAVCAGARGERAMRDAHEARCRDAERCHATSEIHTQQNVWHYRTGLSSLSRTIYARRYSRRYFVREREGRRAQPRYSAHVAAADAAPSIVAIAAAHRPDARW